MRDLDLTRFGGDLLSHVLRRSTIGATALNCRVRDGAGCFARAMTTKPRKIQAAHWYLFGYFVSVINQLLSLSSHAGCVCLRSITVIAVTGSNQAYRTISTSQLNALLRLHLWPIDVVVYHGPQGDLVLKGASRLDAFSGYPFRS